MPSLGVFDWFWFCGGLMIWGLRIDVWDSCTFLCFGGFWLVDLLFSLDLILRVGVA